MASVSCEYQVVRRNYASLTKGISDGLREVVLKAFSRNLITSSTKNECLNDNNPTDGRAEKLLDAVLRKIELNPTFFDDFVSILQEIPALNYLAERLKDDLSHGSDRGCSDVGERTSSDQTHMLDTAAKRLKDDRSINRGRIGDWSKKAVSDNMDDVDSAVADLSLADDGPGNKEAESETPKLAHSHNSEKHLMYFADQIRECTSDKHSTGTHSNDQPDGASPLLPNAHDASFGMPKLEPRENADSGIASFTLPDESDEDDQHLPFSFSTVSSHQDLRHVSDRVLVQDQHANIPIEASNQCLSDTQEPGTDASAHPLVVGASTKSSVSQHPSIIKGQEALKEAGSTIQEQSNTIVRLQEEKGDLRSEIEKNLQSEKEKEVQIQELGREKERTEYQLKDKEMEIQRIKHKKDAKIKELEDRVQKKNEEVEMYKKWLAEKEQEQEREIKKIRQECEEQIRAHRDQKEAFCEQVHESKIRELEAKLKETVKAAEEQKDKAELEKAVLEKQLAEMKEEYKDMVLQKEREKHELEIQKLKLENALAQEKQKNAEINLEIHRSESSAKIKELEEQLAKMTTNDNCSVS